MTEANKFQLNRYWITRLSDTEFLITQGALKNRGKIFLGLFVPVLMIYGVFAALKSADGSGGAIKAVIGMLLIMLLVLISVFGRSARWYFNGDHLKYRTGIGVVKHFHKDQLSCIFVQQVNHVSHGSHLRSDIWICLRTTKNATVNLILLEKGKYAGSVLYDNRLSDASDLATIISGAWQLPRC